MDTIDIEKIKILVVDDEDITLDIISHSLSDEGYIIVTAMDGQEALEVLRANDDVSVIVLDRMMPVMNGMEFHACIKEDEQYKNIPVVMQTAAASTEQVLEGVASGVYYYLTKPFVAETLVSIVKAALDSKRERDNLQNKAENSAKLLGLVQSATFNIRSIEEAKDVASVLSRALPNSKRVMLGLTELLINAIEHGNLGITYDEKKALLNANMWHEEVAERMDRKENKDKYVHIEFTSADDGYKIIITDTGGGFNWKDFVEFDASRATDPNGRGIFLARSTSFDDVSYNDSGNQVTCCINVAAA